MKEQRSETVEKQRQRILNVAIGLIESEGLEAISARKIAAQMSCAVGSLYRNFENIHAILLAVNLETLKALERHVQHAIQINTGDAKENIRGMGLAYIDYVMAHSRLWQLVMHDFYADHHSSAEAYLSQHQRMFHMIEIAFLNLNPSQSKQAVSLEARTLWASLDGLCNLACRGKIERDGEEGVKVLADILLQRFLGDKQ
ncbi:MAG: TetR/AcrR family transcriptional regulator [Zetaproteobacteria bacterium]|nr:TetR/AcrR family transcriptional regulator [Zetaproteobacteria bacterium]